MKRLRANTLKDHWNFLLHCGMTAGLAAGTFAFLGFPPVLGALALGATAGIHFGLNRRIKRALQGAIDEERDYRSGQERFFDPTVQSWLENFTKIFGMKKVPELLVMNRRATYLPEHESGGLKGALRGYLRKTFNSTANAFAFEYTKDNVALTAPIVEQLDMRELKNVVAHEMGHLAAHHGPKRQAMAFIATPAAILTSLNYIVTAYSSFRTAGISLAATSAGLFAALFVAKKLGWSEDYKEDKPKIKSLTRAFATASVVGAGIVLAAPELAVAAGLNYAAHATLHFLGKRYSRCNEFQADRLAAQATGDLEGMIGALRSLQKISLKENLSYRKKPTDLLATAFRKVGELFSTHPTTDRRCEALSDMLAHKQKSNGRDLDFGMRLV